MNIQQPKRIRRNKLAAKLLPFLVVFALSAVACARVSNPEGWAPPTVVDDTLYVTPDNGEMAAVDPSELSELSNIDPRVTPNWLFPATDETICGDELQPEKRDLRGIYGVPQVDAAHVYFGGYDGNVYALDRDDGSCAWIFDAGDSIIGGATLVDSRLYVGSDAGLLHILDVGTGESIASFAAGDSIWVTPLVTESAVYFSTVDGDLFALDPGTLAEIWAEPFSVSGGLITDPVLADESTLLVGGIGEMLYAVDTATGAEKWAFSGDNWFWARPLIQDGTIYASDLSGKVYALDLEGNIVPGWNVFKAAHPIRSSAVLADASLISTLEEDTLIIVDTNGNLYGIGPDDGVGLWPAPAVLGKTIHSDPILFGDTVLASARGGDLFQVDLESEGRGFLKIKVGP